jgi:hypothetical protein
MILEINKNVILEEALTQKQKEIYDTNLGAETGGAVAQVVPVFGPLANTGTQMYGGYKVGEQLDHPTAGTLLGREGALGAASSDGKNDNITLGDAYSKGNVMNRAIGGAIAGGITGAAASSRNIADADPGMVLGGAILGGATVPLITPAFRYGLGKVFGSKK